MAISKWTYYQKCTVTFLMTVILVIITHVIDPGVLPYRLEKDQRIRLNLTFKSKLATTDKSHKKNSFYTKNDSRLWLWCVFVRDVIVVCSVLECDCDVLNSRVKCIYVPSFFSQVPFKMWLFYSDTVMCPFLDCKCDVFSFVTFIASI